MGTRRPPVAGLAEAAEILGVRTAAVRETLTERTKLVPRELRAGPVWYVTELQRARAAWDAGREYAGRPAQPNVTGLAEVAETLGQRRSNIRKFLARRNIAATELKVGPVWYADDIDRVKRAWVREQAKRS